MKKKSGAIAGVIILLCLVVFCVWAYLKTGFFVVKPVDSVPKGATYWYFRGDTEYSFVESPDSIQLEKTGNVTVLGRALVWLTAKETIEENKIAELPYMKFMYKISTGGKDFDK